MFLIGDTLSTPVPIPLYRPLWNPPFEHISNDKCTSCIDFLLFDDGSQLGELAIAKFGSGAMMFVVFFVLALSINVGLFPLFVFRIRCSPPFQAEQIDRTCKWLLDNAFKSNTLLVMKVFWLGHCCQQTIAPVSTNIRTKSLTSIKIKRRPTKISHWSMVRFKNIIERYDLLTLCVKRWLKLLLVSINIASCGWWERPNEYLWPYIALGWWWVYSTRTSRCWWSERELAHRCWLQGLWAIVFRWTRIRQWAWSKLW